MPLASDNLARQSSPQVQPDHHPDRRSQPTLIVALHEHVADAIGQRAEAIARAEGDTRARAFADLAHGRITPLALHVETWLAEPGQRGAFRLRTATDYRRIVAGLAAWLAEQGRPRRSSV